MVFMVYLSIVHRLHKSKLSDIKSCLKALFDF